MWIFFKKSLFFLRKPYPISTCVEDRVRNRRLSWPLLCVKTWLTWLKQSSLCAFSCHWSRPRDIVASGHIDPFLCVFFLPKIGFMWKTYFSLNFLLWQFLLLANCFFVFFLLSLLQLFFKIKILLRESHFFLFSFPCFYFHVFFSFFSPYVLPRRSDGRGQDTSPREMSEGNGGNGHQDLKRRSLVGVIWAWLKVWVDGPESTNENASIWMFWQGLAAIVCFLWLSDTDSPRDIRLCRLVIISSSFSLCIFILFMFASSLERWQRVGGKIGQLEADKLNPEDQMVCVEGPRKIVLEKQKFAEKQLHDLEE